MYMMIYRYVQYYYDDFIRDRESDWMPLVDVVFVFERKIFFSSKKFLEEI